MKDPDNLAVAMRKLGVETSEGYLRRADRVIGFNGLLEAASDPFTKVTDHDKTHRWRKCWLWKSLVDDAFFFIPGSDGQWSPDVILWWIKFLGERGAIPLVTFGHATITFKGEEWYGTTIGRAIGRMGKTWPQETGPNAPVEQKSTEKVEK